MSVSDGAAAGSGGMSAQAADKIDQLERKVKSVCLCACVCVCVCVCVCCVVFVILCCKVLLFMSVPFIFLFGNI